MNDFPKISILFIGLVAFCSCISPKTKYIACSLDTKVCFGIDTAMFNLEIDTLRSDFDREIYLRLTSSNPQKIHLFIYADSISRMPDDFLVSRPLYFPEGSKIGVLKTGRILLKMSQYKLSGNDAATIHYIDENSEIIVTEIEFNNSIAVNIFLSRNLKIENNYDLWNLNKRLVKTITIEESK